MRILILINLFPPGFIGGYELGTLDLARGLQARGHVVEVMTGDFFADDAGELADLPVHRVFQATGFNRSPSEKAALGPAATFVIPRNLRMLAAQLIRFRPDRVLCSNLHGLGLPSLLQFLVGAGHRPLLYLMDYAFLGLEPRQERALGWRAVFGQGDWLDQVDCVLMSRNLQHEVEAGIGRALPQVTLIPGWFDAGGVPAPPPPVAPPAGTPLRCIFASRVAPHKGVAPLLQAARRLLDKGRDGFRIDVYGGGEVPQLLQRVAALGLGDHVHYRGCPPKEELLRRYADYDALLFPTWPREPFGFVVPEAAAAGCIPVMTAGIGAAEWFIDRRDALMLRQPEAPDLARAMLRLMRLSPERRLALRHRARGVAQALLRFDSALDRLEALLRAWQPPPGGIAPRQIRAAETAMTVLTEEWRRRGHG